ncbi:hypothetical protein BK004_01190 [bacterium CG10_46_32]|nr:MAG: hypothetical protein BK004_01190 [bacterium CG10_46_32]PIR56313.1 MAG: hypothetical protein COU73_01205 [Parcubacteria group bacterium CG10_big_fil_rev_8_21_14_0_10_46_32]
MSDIIKHSKKVLSATLTVSTIVWSIGLFALAPVKVGAAAGDLVKAAGSPAVYLVDADGVTIHPFPHQNVYTSWGFPANFSSTFTTNLSGFTVGNDVEFRDGSLIRALETPAVYFISGKKLRPIVSATVFETLGFNYDNITWLPQSFLDKYGTTGDMLTSTTMHPNGTLVKYASSSTLYLLQADQKRAFASTDVAKVNGYANIPVITIPSSETYADGSQVVVKESSLTIPMGVGSAPVDNGVPAGPVGSGLTVSLASTTPAASTLIADSSAGGDDGAQAFVPMTKVALTAGSDGAVKVTSIKFTRGGISANADASALYLFEGDGVDGSFISASSSYNSGVVTFTNTSGLITVPAGSTKYVTLRLDLADDTGSGKTIYFSVPSASDVTTDGASVSGSFPIMGNTMSVATASDLGYVTLANVSPSGAASVNPGTDNHEGWRFTLYGGDQDMEIRHMAISMTGSASSADLKDFVLEVGGVAISETVASLNASDEIVFNFPTPYLVEKGQTKTVSLIFDVVNGSSRTIHFQVQEMYDMNVYDTQYNVYTKLNRADSWTIIESNSSTTNTTINAGSLTVSKSATSPTGNVAVGATGVTLAKFDFKATGEDVKISSLTVSTPSALNGMDNVKVYFKGAQVGSTSDSDATNNNAAFTFGASVVIAAGTTEVIEIRGDTKTDAAVNYSAAASISVTLDAGSSNARALSSSTSISTPSVTGNTLTGSTGTLTVAENTSVGDASASNPTGVKGQQNVLLGSFVVTAGAGEGVSITQITLTDDVAATAGSSLADTFQNMRLESGGPADVNGNYAAGTAIGTTVGTLTDTIDTTYNFNASPSIKLGVANQMVVNIYADILSSASTTQLDTVNADTTGVVYPSTVTATGTETNSSANAGLTVNGVASTAGLQNLYLAANGTLTVENVAGSSQVKTNILTSGATGVSLYKFKATALTENVDITRFIISDTIASATLNATDANGKPTSTLKNFKLYAGDTLVGSLSSLNATAAPTLGGYLDFNLGSGTPYTLVAGTEQTFTLKADVNAWPSISSGSTHTFSLDADPLGTDGTAKSVTARGIGSSVDLSGPAATVTGNALTVRRAYPLVEALPLSNTTLSGGATTQIGAAKFKVTAVGGQVRLKKMTFEVSLTDSTTSTALSLNNFKVYRNGTLMSSTEYSIFDGTGTAAGDELSHSGTAALTTLALGGGLGTHTGNAANSTSTRIVLMLGTQRTDMDGTTNAKLGAGEEVIDAGTSNTYEIKLDVANAHVGASTDSDSITVQLLGDDSETAALTQDLGAMAVTTYRSGIVGLPSTNYNFLWSDFSANTGDHTSVFKLNTLDTAGTGKDWTHGYQVPSSSGQDAYIPLDAWRLSKS